MIFQENKTDNLSPETTLSNTVICRILGNQLTDIDAKQVAEAMKNNMSLSSLDLSYNYFGELGGIRLAAGLVSKIINPLDFCLNGEK